MLKVCTLSLLATVLGGCVPRATAWKGPVEWPTDDDAELVAPSVEAGTALAAAAAIREMVRTNTDPRLFRGCSSPEQGLDVAVFTGPTPGVYAVARADACSTGGTCMPSLLKARWWLRLRPPSPPCQVHRGQIQPARKAPEGARPHLQCASGRPNFTGRVPSISSCFLPLAPCPPATAREPTRWPPS